MTIITSIFERIARCCGVAMLCALIVSPAHALQPRPRVDTAYSDGNFSKDGMTDMYGRTAAGLSVPNNTTNFSVTAQGICRYLDVGVAPGATGILIPFWTPEEWVGSASGAASKGFLATNSMRPFVKLDFCRPATSQTANYTSPGGISDPSSVVAGQQTTVSYSFAQKRIKASVYTDADFADSLTERQPKDFNMSRKDCLGNTTYPDGSVRNPCYIWSWVEQITATFIDNIGNTRAQAAAAATAVPVQAGVNNWNYTLARTACVGPNGTANDGRAVPVNTCPPTVQPPVLRACPPQNHNTHHWVTVSTGNVRNLHDCGAGYVEDPTRRYTYDLQADYWCFDSTDYPTGSTREINGVTSGTCKPIVNGQVGPVNGTSVGALDGNSPGLCNVGAVANFAATNTGWSWTCKGQNTGTDAQGTADHAVSYNLTCQQADSSLNNGGSVGFNCTRFDSSSNTCSGTQTATSSAGCCKAGQPNTASFPTTFGATVQGCDAPAGTCSAATGLCGGTVIAIQEMPGYIAPNDRTSATAFCLNAGGTCCAVSQFGTPDSYNTPTVYQFIATNGTPVTPNGTNYDSRQTLHGSDYLTTVDIQRCGAPTNTYGWDTGNWTCTATPPPVCGDSAANACSYGTCNAGNNAGVYRDWQNGMKFTYVCNCGQWGSVTDQGRYGHGGITQNCPI